MDTLSRPVQFPARVREQLANNSPSEYKTIVTLRRQYTTHVLELQRYRNADNINRKGSTNNYRADRCLKITDWPRVQHTASLVAHFIIDPPSANRSTTTAKRQVAIVALRDWSVESADDISLLWKILSQEAAKRKEASVARRKQTNVQNTKSLSGGGGRKSVICEQVRRKERAYGNKTNTPKKSTSVSQGRRIAQAMADAALATQRSPYSELTRGATGKRTYASALIGEPNLSGFSDTQSPSKKPTSRKRSYADTPRCNSPIPVPTPPKPLVRNASQLSVHNVHKSSQSPSEQPDLKAPSQTPPKAPEPIELPASPGRVTRSSTTNQRSSDLPAGIANDGNTCYISAVLQTLMNDSSLMERMQTALKSRESNLLPFASALADMNQQRLVSSVLQPNRVRSAVSHHFSEFSSSRQQDVHEFFLRCLDVLDREFTGCELSTSPTHSNYSLVQETKFVCTSCGESTDPRCEILRGLSLDIPESLADGSDLQQLVDTFFDPQTVDLNCEKCQSGKQARSSSDVLFAPRVLALHIKRFRVAHDDVQGTLSVEKATDHISLPETLSLDSSLSPRALSFHSLDHPVSNLAPKFPEAKQVEMIDSETDTIQAVKSSKTSTSGKRVQARFRIFNKDGSDRVGESGCGEDEIVDDTIERRSERDVSKQVAALIPFGLSHRNAEQLVRKCNYDSTAAIAAALDMRKGNSSAAPRLDDALLSHVSTLADSKLVSGHVTSMRYGLKAVIRHSSSITERGHYVTDVRQGDGEWVCYNDSSTSRLSSTEEQSQDGYMCYYVAE